MIVTCIKTPRAIVAETAPHTHDELNLASFVDLDVVGQMVGYDEAPILVDGSPRCGNVFEIPDEPWLWDVNTETRDDGTEWVIERHLSVPCPKCGSIADFFTEPLDTPYLFEHADLSKRERALLTDPTVMEIFDALPEDKREKLAEAFRRGFAYVHEGRILPYVGGGMADTGYSHVTEGAVALTAATAKSVLGVKAGSAVGLSLTFYKLGFDGVTASAVPVNVELCYCTYATNAPGTNSTGTTERQDYGRVITPDWTGGRNWTTEPTTITVNEETLLGAFMGSVIYDFPLGKEPDCALSEGFVIRLTAPAAVNVRATQNVRHT